MPKKKTSPAPSGKSAAGPAGQHVNIRMYNVGFGDCFLLTFPAADRPRKVLIDCGVHFSGKNPKPPFAEVVAKLIEDITENGVPTVDLLIATHRHQDHVSGFENPAWKAVEVGEVWMPWTEDYTNELAREILNKQSKKAEKLHALLTAMAAEPQRFGLSAAKKADIEKVKKFSENSLKNTEAMNMLHHGFARGDAIPRSYLPYQDRTKNSIRSERLPGVTVHLMGPSYDKEVIRDMDPPADEKWFKMKAAAGNGNSDPHRPFHVDWSIDAATLDPQNTLVSAEDKKAIQSASDDSEFAVAKRLEDSVNGTSLMLMFQVGKAFLFFPGDAQHGTWQSALKDSEWRELLTKTNFYKVGHHGSHNATPKEFVHEILNTGANCKAMVSLFPVEDFPEIPKVELFRDLAKVPVEYVRSDVAADTGDPAEFVRTTHYVETKIPI